MLLEAFCDKTNTPIAPGSVQHAQLSLSVKEGGHGLRRYGDILDFTWWSSQAACAPLLARAKYQESARVAAQRQEVLTRIRLQANAYLEADRCAELENLLPPDASRFIEFYTQDPSAAEGLQARLTKIATARRLKECMKSKMDEARMMSLRSCKDGITRWPLVLPATPDRRMSDLEVADAVKQRLGLAPTVNMPEMCGRCSKPIGPQDPYHPLTCVPDTGRGKTTRHNDLAREIQRAIQDAGGSAELEPKRRDPESKKRVDLDVWLGDENLWIDVTCVHALAPSNINRKDPIESAAGFKERKYSNMVERQEGLIKFVPFVTDTYGKLGSEAVEFIDKLATFAQANGRGDADCFRGDLMDRLAICLQQNNSRITRNWLTEMRHKATCEGRVKDAQRAVDSFVRRVDE
jgi:hypothetical protein